MDQYYELDARLILGVELVEGLEWEEVFVVEFALGM